MSETTFDAGAYIDASLPLLGMTLTPESRAVVKLHLETASKLANLVTDFELEDEAEPATVYTP